MHIFQRTGPNAVSNVGLEIAAVDDGPLCGLQGTMTVVLTAGPYVAQPLFVNSDMIVNIALFIAHCCQQEQRVRFDSMHRTSHLHAILTLAFAFQIHTTIGTGLSSRALDPVLERTM
jgi:uncharacterized membrane protein